MDFDLSADQAALRDAARELLDDRCPTTRVRSVHERGLGWDAELWARMVEQGWLGVTMAETEGGLGLGVVELGVLLEELGRHVAPVPFLPTAVTIELARRAGADDLVAELVDGSANRVHRVESGHRVAARRREPDHGSFRSGGVRSGRGRCARRRPWCRRACRVRGGSRRGGSAADGAGDGPHAAARLARARRRRRHAAWAVPTSRRRPSTSVRPRSRSSCWARPTPR